MEQFIKIISIFFLLLLREKTSKQQINMMNQKIASFLNEYLTHIRYTKLVNILGIVPSDTKR